MPFITDGSMATRQLDAQVGFPFGWKISHPALGTLRGFLPRESGNARSTYVVARSKNLKKASAMVSKRSAGFASELGPLECVPQSDRHGLHCFFFLFF